MNVRHFDLKPPKTQPPRERGWEKTWYGFHGYYAMTKCVSQQTKAGWEERNRAERVKGLMNEGEFQQDCFLSVLADIKREYVNMFELGAGWGRLCLALAGVVDYRVIPPTPESYRCLAVEAEPTHYQWAKEHFEIQNINGMVIQGAVSDKNGTCRFNLQPDPAACYGQAIDPRSIRKILGIGYLSHIITKRKNIDTSIKVPMYTIDYLINTYVFDHLDILQMDVQGAEYKVMLGAAESIKGDLIDYYLIVDLYRDSVLERWMVFLLLDVTMGFNYTSGKICDGVL